MKNLKRLGKAKELAILNRQYDIALEIINNLLDEDAKNIDALRLKGNILDLKALDLQQTTLDDSISMQLFEDARECYEKILQIDQTNTLAHIDLGNYWDRKGEHQVALDYYDKAICLIEKGFFYVSLEEECEDAYWNKAELLKRLGKIKEYHQCIEQGLLRCPISELLKDILPGGRT